uniref:Cytidine/deoxycytidylate deaminase zinc-binding domain-containing protein n=1 Tax=Oryza glumipatula TaxID=40148 RepID=A0A0E0ABT8_9ORYZ
MAKGVCRRICLESVAYNPTLCPVQAAIIGMVAAGGAAAARDVVAATLVEKEAALVSQEVTARIFLAAVAPQASFHVYNFGPSDA